MREIKTFLADKKTADIDEEINKYAEMRGLEIVSVAMQATTFHGQIIAMVIFDQFKDDRKHFTHEDMKEYAEYHHANPAANSLFNWAFNNQKK